MLATLSGWAAMTSRNTSVAASRSPTPSPQGRGRTRGRASAGPRARPPDGADARRPPAVLELFAVAASAREAMRMACAPDSSTRASCSVGRPHFFQGCRTGELIGADTARDTAPDRLRLRSGPADQLAAPAQSRPIPRCAASIASATPSPCDHRWRRKARVASQSTAAAESGVTSANGSATTCAAEKTVREVKGAPVVRASGTALRPHRPSTRRSCPAVEGSQRDLRHVETAALGRGPQPQFGELDAVVLARRSQR